MAFQLAVDYRPKGDQETAIEQLTQGLRDGDQHQVLLGVTGSGKTFTMAKVIEASGRPALVLAHNKLLAAQLYHEFKTFFPHNAVEYFVSYYDYYQPEAYIPSGDVYIEKEATINDELDKLRLSATKIVVRAPRLRDRRECQLHLRPRFARSVLRHAPDARERAEDPAQGVPRPAGGDSVRAQRRRFPTRHFPGSRRCGRVVSHLRRLCVPDRVLGRRDREPVANRSAARPSPADVSAIADLSQDALRRRRPESRRRRCNPSKKSFDGGMPN